MFLPLSVSKSAEDGTVFGPQTQEVSPCEPAVSILMSSPVRRPRVRHRSRPPNRHKGRRSRRAGLESNGSAGVWGVMPSWPQLFRSKWIEKALAYCFTAIFIRRVIPTGRMMLQGIKSYGQIRRISPLVLDLVGRFTRPQRCFCRDRTTGL